MLDRLLKALLGRIDTYADAARMQREQIERERAGDDARAHAGREFANSEGYTTPLPVAAENAQNAYARARRDFEKNGGIEALSLAVSLMIARERRDEAAAALKKHHDGEAQRKSGSLHVDAKPFFDLMFEHGVLPRHLANVRPELVAIICDLIRWDGHDPEMQDTSSPVPAIFGTYASRLILKPGQFGSGARSSEGTPVSPERYSDPRHYLFEAISAGSARQADDQVTDGTDLKAGTQLVTLPIQLGADAEQPLPVVTIQSDVAPRSAGTAGSDAHDDPSARPPSADGRGSDEFALPERFTTEDVAKLRASAIAYMEQDDDWEFDLSAAAGFWRDGSTTADIIQRVEATPDDPHCTPFRYFALAARRKGLEAGRAAYRDATVERLMLEIATAPKWAQGRASLGLR